MFVTPNEELKFMFNTGFISHAANSDDKNKHKILKKKLWKGKLIGT